ncbi:acyltransferase [Rhodoferax sp.]|uniref:LpxL/LpxP family acyltransferase n=1 Tax=Rhodoferax sp. TaxID=50421 RepID=UPI002ACD5136|nr:acyltransferase [Rhodoferax sp.]
MHRLFGRWPFRVCLYPVVFALWCMHSRVRRASMEYLQHMEQSTGALGHAPRARDSLQHLLLFAETLLDKLLAVSGRYRFEHVQTEGRESLYEAAQQRLGGVIVVAHMGCLELCRAMAEHSQALKLNVLVHTKHATEFNRVLQKLNPANSINLIEVETINLATSLVLSEKVARGEYVVIAGDRIPVTASQTVDVEFLGRQAPFPVGPYVLSSLLKCPLYFLGCIHAGRGYIVHFELLTEQVVLPRGQRQAHMAQYAALYARALTALLVRSPYDWFNFFPFWDQSHDIRLP